MSARPSLEPLTLAGTTFPNRIFRPAHQTQICPGGRVSDRFIAYHSARARGGAGLLILDGAPIHQTSAASSKLLSIWDDAAIEGLARMRAAVADTPARMFIQLWHGGANTMPRDGGPPWSASPIAGFANGVVAMQMTQWMIDEIIEAYALAAARAVAAGLEGIEIHGAHGYLPQQFLSSAINLRTDDYGGPIENRARFTIEMMRAIRRATPEGFCCGIKIGPELVDGLTTIDDLAWTVDRLRQENLVDFITLSTGSYVTSEAVSAALHAPAGYQIDTHRGLRDRIGVPVFVTGRYRALDEADAALRDGEADMVGMVRAMIAEPDLVRKAMIGREETVRPCIACNQRCVAGIAGPAGFGCAVNPAAGREAFWERRAAVAAEAPQRVLIVGGGIAGMEAARLAALRGHQVTLREAMADLGGKVRLAAVQVPRMGALGDLTAWQENELRRLGVTIDLNSYVDADDVLAFRPDRVVIATGAPDPDRIWQRHRPGHRIEGADLPHVRSSVETLLTDPARLGKRVVVIDDTGHFEAGAMAEYLVAAGLDLVFVTRLPAFLPLMEAALRATPLYERLHRTGRFRIRLRAQVDRIDREAVTLFDPRFDAAPERIAADCVVTVTHGVPDTALADALAAASIPVDRIGDALSPRFIEGAVADAWMIATH